MLDKFIQDVKNKPPIENKEVLFNPLTNVSTNPKLLLDVLANVSTIDSTVLYDMISNGYHHLLNKKFIDSNAAIVAKAFIDEKFIGIFSQILMTKADQFTFDEKISCNRLIYEYIIYKKNNKQTMSKLYSLARILNQDTIPLLYGYGFENQTILDLVISRYSTKDEVIAMKRVNCVIINSDINVMTEQNIIFIYEKLFERLTPMFEGIMYDVWDPDKMRLDQEEIYGRITLALLTILENAPFDTIMAVLSNFAQSKQLLHQKDPLRINLKAIAVSDYSRVVSAVNAFEAHNNFSLN